jgi:hypothetical protein
MEAVCFALLFADRIITENNGKKGLIGVFSNFNFPKFPAIAPQWFIFAALTNLKGKHEFSINIVRDDAQHVVLPIAGEIDVQDDGKDIEIILPINNLTFQKPGKHTLTFNIDGMPLASRILDINQVEASGG